MQLKIETGWSSAIIDYIRDMDEANVYISAGLKEGRVNGKAALLNPTIVGEAAIGGLIPLIAGLSAAK